MKWKYGIWINSKVFLFTPFWNRPSPSGHQRTLGSREEIELKSASRLSISMLSIWGEGRKQGILLQGWNVFSKPVHNSPKKTNSHSFLVVHLYSGWYTDTGFLAPLYLRPRFMDLDVPPCEMVSFAFLLFPSNFNWRYVTVNSSVTSLPTES